jgi:ribonuclease HI
MALCQLQNCQKRQLTGLSSTISDGSGLNEGIGAAAILYAKNRHTPISQLKLYVGPETKHNTYEAETIGAILGTRLLSNCPDSVGKNVSLYIDNQAVILAVKNPKATPGQYLTRQFILHAKALRCNLGIHWISSHSKVKGNEKVDELAKEAANGRSSARARLPHTLRGELPTSASAIKQDYHKVLKAKWEKRWTESERSRRMESIDRDFPFTKFRKRTHPLTRSQASIMTQIRCGHIPLNAYLARINKSETEYCQACMDNEDGLHCRETIKHVIFECSSYELERVNLRNKIGLRHFNLRSIMNPVIWEMFAEH